MDENGNELPGGEKTIVIKNGKVGSYYFTTEKDFDKAAILPQAGDKKENNNSVMGLVSLGLAGLLGLGIKRKEEKDNH